MKKFITVEECEKLSLDEVARIYRNHVSPSLLNLLSIFSFSKDKIVKADGVWLETENGKKILDVTGGNGVLNLGHNPKEILDVRKRHQDLHRPEVIKSFLNSYLAAASFNLANLLPESLTHVYFCNSGAEAAEGALKLSYKYFNGKRKFLLHSNTAFHGKLLATSQITGVLEKGFKYQSCLEADSFEYNNCESLITLVEKHVNGTECDIYAVIVEPFSATGITYLTEDFIKLLFKLREKYKFKVIFDEIYTGFFKTGPAFSFMAYEFVPDIVLVSKTLGGGKASISAYVSSEEMIKKCYPKTNEALIHSTTYNGFAEECVTAIEALRILHTGDWENEALRIENVARREFDKYKVSNRNFYELAGRGSLLAIKLNYDPQIHIKIMTILPSFLLKDDRFHHKLLLLSIVEYLYSKHNILSLFMNNSNASLMFTPSLIIKDEEICKFFQALDEALGSGLDKIVFDFVKNKFLDKILP